MLIKQQNTCSLMKQIALKILCSRYTDRWWFLCLTTTILKTVKAVYLPGGIEIF